MNEGRADESADAAEPVLGEIVACEGCEDADEVELEKLAFGHGAGVGFMTAVKVSQAFVRSARPMPQKMTSRGRRLKKSRVKK